MLGFILFGGFIKGLPKKFLSYVFALASFMKAEWIRGKKGLM
mgnify:FL=1